MSATSRGYWPSKVEACKPLTTQDLDGRLEGIGYRSGREWLDEIPDAYKDTD